jgi:signal transduction histidine kinase
MKNLLFILFLLPLFALSQDTTEKKIKINAIWVEPEVVFHEPVDTPKLSANDVASIEADKAFLKGIPSSYENISPTDMKSLATKFENQIQKLMQEKEALLKSGASAEVIESKSTTINSLEKEKKIVNLSVDNKELSVETGNLKTDKKKLRSYLIGSVIGILLLILSIVVLLQRKTIGVKDQEIEKQLNDINKKNNYLEHAARIIRHDMHSGINTYMPRGITSLEKRISGDKAKELKIDGSIKMIKEGLSHTQKVYKSVYEFTNLVKENPVLEKNEVDLKELLDSYTENTSYKLSVAVSSLGKHNVNPYLFCTAIDNLIRNGLKFNDSEVKTVKIFEEDGFLVVEDNGKGLKPDDFEKIKKNKKKQG